MTSQKALSIYLVRHGDTGYSQRFLGVTDVGITAKGLKQIQEIKPAILALAPETIWVSPMKRCRESLSAITAQTLYVGKETVIKELQEINFGRWEKKSFAEVAEEEPEQVNKWIKDKKFTFPEGESIANFHKRMGQIKQKIDNLQSRSLLIIAHGGVIRSLVCLLLGLEQEKFLIFDIAPARITEILYFNEGGVLRCCNAKELVQREK